MVQNEFDEDVLALCSSKAGDCMTISDNQSRYFMQCWSAQKDYQPIAVEKTEGCWIHVKEGRKIFDLRSAHECINLGFNHPEVLEAIQDQLKKVIYVTDDFATEPAAALSKLLAQVTPGSSNKKIWFGQSGAASIEAAIRGARLFQYNKLMEKGAEAFNAARQYPYPYKIITRYRSWHGASLGALSASGDPRKWFGEPLTAPGFVQAPEAYPFRSPFGDDPDGTKSAAYLRHMVEMEGGSGSVAAILLEPVVGSNGIIPTPKKYMEEVADLCKTYDLLLIMDETMTGMGRTGKLLATEYYDIEPDIIVMGKALGAYAPLSATIFSERVARSFEENIFGYGQSYSGHALSAAAALASLKVVLKEGFLEEVQDKGAYLKEKLLQLKENHSCVGEVRGIGMMWTVELIKNQKNNNAVRSFLDKYEDNPVKTAAKYLLDEHDIYMPSDKFGLWIVPPLIVTREEMDWLTEAFDDTLTLMDNNLGHV